MSATLVGVRQRTVSIELQERPKWPRDGFPGAGLLAGVVLYDVNDLDANLEAGVG